MEVLSLRLYHLFIFFYLTSLKHALFWYKNGEENKENIKTVWRGEKNENSKVQLIQNISSFYIEARKIMEEMPKVKMKISSFLKSKVCCISKYLQIMEAMTKMEEQRNMKALIIKNSSNLARMSLY